MPRVDLLGHAVPAADRQVLPPLRVAHPPAGHRACAHQPGRWAARAGLGAGQQRGGAVEHGEPVQAARTLGQRGANPLEGPGERSDATYGAAFTEPRFLI